MGINMTLCDGGGEGRRGKEDKGDSEKNWGQ